MSKQLEDELKERLHVRKLDQLTASFSGACISSGHVYSTEDDRQIFVKTNASLNASVMFDGELESLNQINATQTIMAPKGITVFHNYDAKNTSAIAMEFLKISPLSAGCAEKLGKSLANLHNYNEKVIRFTERASRWIGMRPPSVKHLKDTDSIEKEDHETEDHFSKHYMKVGQIKQDKKTSEQNDLEYPTKFVPHSNAVPVKKFGFNVPTSCGSIPQVNEWMDDWVSFFSRHRLDVTIRSLLSDHSDRELHELWSNLQLKVDKLFDDFEHRGLDEGQIVPALLHGDLWSGNAAEFSDGSDGVVYDPASFYGHSEYDFGIVRMFRGFPFNFEKAYFEIIPKKKNFEERNKLYQLFHHLNHWNHFGSGYRSSSLSIMKSISKNL